MLFETFAYSFCIFESLQNLLQKTLGQPYLFITCGDLWLPTWLWTKSHGCAPTRYAKSNGIQFQQTLPVASSELTCKPAIPMPNPTGSMMARPDKTDGSAVVSSFKLCIWTVTLCAFLLLGSYQLGGRELRLELTALCRA